MGLRLQEPTRRPTSGYADLLQATRIRMYSPLVNDFDTSPAEVRETPHAQLAGASERGPTAPCPWSCP